MKRTLLILLALAALLVPGCDEEVVNDATFRLWCRDALCEWRLDEGAVRPAPTWHAADRGVSFEETPTTISQSLRFAPACVKVRILADIAPSADMALALDFDGDGKPDVTHPFFTTGFDPYETTIGLPASDFVPRVFVTKRGTGRAVLASFGMRNGNCSTHIAFGPRVVGDRCSSAGECASRVCCQGRCAECCPASDAGWEDPQVDCASDAATCNRRIEVDAGIVSPVPFQCGGGLRDRGAGATCLADDDCASGACEGVIAVGRAEDGGSESCDFPDAGACKLAHVREGRCR
jgi:hypothetical protein